MSDKEKNLQSFPMNIREVEDSDTGSMKRRSPPRIVEMHLKKRKVEDAAGPSAAAAAAAANNNTMPKDDRDSVPDLLNWTMKYMDMVNVDSADSLDKYVDCMLEVTFKDYMAGSQSQPTRASNTLTPSNEAPL